MMAGFYLGEAKRLLALRELDESLASLTKAESWTPHDPNVSFLLARIYRRQGNMDDFASQLKRAQDLGYDQQRVTYEGYLALAQAGQMQKVEQHLPHMLVNASDDGQEIFEAFVSGYFANYQFPQAMKLIEYWVNEFPLDERPHLYVAMFHENGQQWKQAAEKYRIALEVAPKNSEARLKLANVLIELQKHEEAVKDLELLLQKSPDDLKTQLAWAQCKKAMGATDEARQILTKLSQSNADDIDVANQYGQLEAEAGNHEEAVNWFRKVIEKKPFERSARYALATSLRATGKSDEAKEHFEYTSASAKAHSRIQKLLDGLRTKPNDIAVRYEVGTLLLKYGDPAEAITWLRGVLEINPAHRASHLVLLEHYKKVGNRTSEEYHRNRLQQIPNPDDAPGPAPLDAKPTKS